MNSKNLTLRYSFVQCFLWMGYAVLPGFQSVFLLAAGFTNAQIGIISATAFIISAFLQPAVASYADRPKSQSVKVILIFVNIIMLVFSALLVLLKNFMWPVGIIFGLCISLLILMTPLVNSLGAESMSGDGKLNFGVARGIGSLGYGILAFASGQIVAKFGPSTIPFFILFVYLGFMASMIFFPFKKIVKDENDSSTVTEKNENNFFLKKYPSFALTLLGCVFLYASHTLINNYAFQIISNLGGGSAELGTAMTLCAFLELPTMFFFAYYLKVAKLSTWFCASGVFMAVKTVATLLSGNLPFFFAIQIFQMFGWALISVSSVYYVNENIGAKDSVKGQAYMVTSYTVGCVLGSISGGQLLDTLGVRGMLAAASVFAVLGMATVLLSSRKNQHSKASSL